MLLEGADLDQDGCPDRQDAIAVRLDTAPAEQEIHFPASGELLVDGVLVDPGIKGRDLSRGAVPSSVIPLSHQVHQVVVPGLAEVFQHQVQQVACHEIRARHVPKQLN